MKSIIIIICLLFAKLTFGQWNQSNFVPTGNCYEVDFPSENAAYIIGDFGLLYKSNDEGITWTKIYDFGPFTNPTDLKFINADTGFINIYEDYYRTFDGGVSWTQFGTFSQLKVFQNKLFASFTNNDTTFIDKSVDLGNTWTTIYQNNEPANQPYVFSVVDESSFYFINPNELDRVYKTVDNFLTTDTLYVTNGNIVLQEQFDFKDLQNGYHYGSWGSQSNPTRTWSTGTFYFPIDLDGFGVLPVLDLDFKTSKLYASSLYGKIFYSTNNGQNWTEQTTPINTPVFSISFFNEDKGIAISNNTVLYTNNGGIVGISEINGLSSSIQIYPNPARSFLQIENASNTEIRSIELFDIGGKKIKTFNKTHMNLNITDINSGTYFLRIATNKGELAQKVVIE